MVKLFSHADREAVAQAIAEAERKTCAELVIVVAPASDIYQDYMLLYGLIAGSTIGFGLWASKTIVIFPFLFAIQLVAMGLLVFIPWLQHLCLRLVPKRIRHHRAAHRACEEYLAVSRHIPAATPIVLLYVSVAEHYAYILTSRLVREKITDERWNSVIREFSGGIRKLGLRDSCINAIKRMAELIAPHFPEGDEVHSFSNHVIEIKQSP